MSLIDTLIEGCAQGCAVRKIEGCPVLLICEIQAAQHMESMKNLLRKIEGCPVLWICEIQAAQHMESMKNLRFLVPQKQRLGNEKLSNSKAVA